MSYSNLGGGKMSILTNLKVSKKLAVIVVPAIAALILLLILFIYRSNNIVNETKKALYDETFVSTASILNADRDFYQATVAEKELFVGSVNLNLKRKEQLIEEFNENVTQTLERINGALDNIKGNKELYSEFKHPTSDVTLEQLEESFQMDFTAWQNASNIEDGTGNMVERIEKFDLARNNINLMTELLEEYAAKRSTDIYAEVENSIIVSTIFISIIIFIIAILAVVIVNYLRKNIKYITDISQRIAQGELSDQIDETKITRDEIGQLCEATGHILSRLNGYVSYINEITEVLNTMAQGDMRITLHNDYVGEFYAIKQALLDIASSLNITLTNISNSSEEVNAGAEQVSSGAQVLSQGTTEQAATIEELSSSIAEISHEVEKNADNVKRATNYVEEAVSEVETSNKYMQQMLMSMNEINSSSSEINKIIKVIDDIAFQTNILALNAAVEAARAGSAGKGFAVVADEVRNLASKSADAAKQTTVLIEGSINAVSGGLIIAEDTAKSLEEVSKKSLLTKNIILEIDSASSAQALSIKEITQGLEQISAVIQSNSATAEESAAASMELFDQSKLLNAEINKFKLS